MAGFVLSIIAFPAKATPGEVPQSVLMALAVAFVLSTIPGLIAAIFYGMLRVTRVTHDATKAALVLKRRAELEMPAALPATDTVSKLPLINSPDTR